VQFIGQFGHRTTEMGIEAPYRPLVRGSVGRYGRGVHELQVIAKQSALGMLT
jgi:hypothetical protein